MAQATFGSPLKKVYGETASLTTTALHQSVRPTYHEVKMYCASDWRIGLAPRLARVKYYNGTTYTDYTTYATDCISTTHVPLDAMTTAHTLYMGVTAPARGFYFYVLTNVNDNAATLDMEYLYDVAGQYSTGGTPYYKITGTVSAALTVGETVTGGTSAATAIHVYDNGSTYIVVKNISGTFAIGETISGAAQNISSVTAIDPVAKGTGYFTDVASDADGTDVGPGDTLKQAGLYAFTLPSVVQGSLTGIDAEPLYWYRFAPSATLSAAVDIAAIIPACDTVNYGYMTGGIEYQFSVNTANVGAFEFDHASTGTLYITWIQH